VFVNPRIPGIVASRHGRHVVVVHVLHVQVRVQIQIQIQVRIHVRIHVQVRIVGWHERWSCTHTAGVPSLVPRHVFDFLGLVDQAISSTVHANRFDRYCARPRRKWTIHRLLLPARHGWR